MLYAGDFDLMQPLFRMYREAACRSPASGRGNTTGTAERSFRTMYFWGTYNNDNYGWNRQGKPDGLTDNTYIRYYWDGALELAAIMLDYYALTGDEQFAGETLVPLARDTLHFYERHYPKRDAEGRSSSSRHRPRDLAGRHEPSLRHRRAAVRGRAVA